MNEMNAIRFLRAAIHHAPGEKLADGRIEPGWCCTEHSVIASIAFRICGLDSFLSHGMAIIGTSVNHQIIDVLPHSFVTLGQPPRGVFDSSLTFGRVAGLPVQYVAYPRLGVGYVAKKPTQKDFIREFAISNEETYILYSAGASEAPDASLLNGESGTPFGQWLTQRYGTQNGLWGKAAHIVSRHLIGDLIFNTPAITREEIWDTIVSSPNQDDAILPLLSYPRPERL